MTTDEVPDDEIAENEWIQRGNSYGEFLVTAKVLNRYGPPAIAMEEEE